MHHILFVYGTLKQGHPRDSALSGQKYLGVARTVDSFAMFDLGGYPGLVYATPDLAAGVKIWGEIYEVSEECLLKLDKIEGVEIELYGRKEIELDHVNLCHLPLYNNTFHNLHRKVVYTYVYLNDVSDKKNCGVYWFLR